MYWDVLARIKNAAASKKDYLLTPYSKMDLAVFQVLAKENFLKSVERRVSARKPTMEIKLSYLHGKPRISGTAVVSKPGRRIYRRYDELHAVKQGHGLAILSTSQGIMTSREARKVKVGGEYLFEIW